MYFSIRAIAGTLLYLRFPSIWQIFAVYLSIARAFPTVIDEASTFATPLTVEFGCRTTVLFDTTRKRLQLFRHSDVAGVGLLCSLTARNFVSFTDYSFLRIIERKSTPAITHRYTQIS